jgi:hypothetical protein
MLLILLDEPTLFVFESREEAIRTIEPPDAECEIRAVYDECAVPYRVEWDRPNVRTRSFFGLIPSIKFGSYRLEPDGAPDIDGLLTLLADHPDCDPPEEQTRVDEVRARLHAV